MRVRAPAKLRTCAHIHTRQTVPQRMHARTHACVHAHVGTQRCRAHLPRPGLAAVARKDAAPALEPHHQHAACDAPLLRGQTQAGREAGVRACACVCRGLGNAAAGACHHCTRRTHTCPPCAALSGPAPLPVPRSTGPTARARPAPPPPRLHSHGTFPLLLRDGQQRERGKVLCECSSGEATLRQPSRPQHRPCPAPPSFAPLPPSRHCLHQAKPTHPLPQQPVGGAGGIVHGVQMTVEDSNAALSPNWGRGVNAALEL